MQTDMVLTHTPCTQIKKPACIATPTHTPPHTTNNGVNDGLFKVFTHTRYGKGLGEGVEGGAPCYLPGSDVDHNEVQFQEQFLQLQERTTQPISTRRSERAVLITWEGFWEDTVVRNQVSVKNPSDLQEQNTDCCLCESQRHPHTHIQTYTTPHTQTQHKERTDCPLYPLLK